MEKKLEICDSVRILEIVEKEGASVHFSGVGGAGMSPLFLMARRFGISATGTDIKSSPLLCSLIESGEDIVIGSRSVLPRGTALLVYSHAIGEDDPERRYARAAGIPEVTRAEFLASLMTPFSSRISVSGTHGKSTVTAMIYSILKCSGTNPTALSGASLSLGGSAFALGALDYMVFEACEYKNSFLAFSPTLSVFTNIELDHVDCFRDMESLEDSFLLAMRRAECLVVNADDTRLYSLAKRSERPYVTLSLGRENNSHSNSARKIKKSASFDTEHKNCLPSDTEPDGSQKQLCEYPSAAHTAIAAEGLRGEAPRAEYTYKILDTRPRAMKFELFCADESLGIFDLPLLGVFNIENAALAAAAALSLGVKPECAREALSSFFGIERRLEAVGKFNTADLYYDYAHHPTEIRCSIEALRAAYDGRIAVIFSPHTYSRTEHFLSELAEALSLADTLLLTPITAARETDDKRISSEILAARAGGRVISSRAQLSSFLVGEYSAIVFMGAGEFNF